MSEVTLPVPCEVCYAAAGQYCLTVSKQNPVRWQRAANIHRPRLVAIVRHRAAFKESA